jgi:plasmid maintenance system antidote protein VapI
MTYKTKKDAIAVATALGLSENDVAQIGNTRYKTTWEEAINLKKRLNAAKDDADYWKAIEEAAEDTVRAAYADANDLHPVAPGNTPATAMHIPPGNVLLIGGAIGVAAHLAHLL